MRSHIVEAKPYSVYGIEKPSVRLIVETSVNTNLNLVYLKMVKGNSVTFAHVSLDDAEEFGLAILIEVKKQREELAAAWSPEPPTYPSLPFKGE